MQQSVQYAITTEYCKYYLSIDRVRTSPLILQGGIHSLSIYKGQLQHILAFGSSRETLSIVYAGHPLMQV